MDDYKWFALKLLKTGELMPVTSNGQMMTFDTIKDADQECQHWPGNTIIFDKYTATVGSFDPLK